MQENHVLIISASEIFPTITGGTVHTGGVARSLRRMGYTVRIYCVAARRESYARRGESVDAHIEEAIEPGLIQQTHLGLWFGLLQTLARRLGMPRVWQYWLMRLGWVPRALKKAAAEADIVICDMPHTPPLPGKPGHGGRGNTPWYLMSHDLTWHQLSLRPFKERIWTGWMRRVEADAPRLYTDIIAVTHEDRNFFAAHDRGGRLQLPIIGSAILPDNYRGSAELRAATRASLGLADDEWMILFSGSRFGPNIEALENILAFCHDQQSWLAEHRLRIVLVGSIEPEPYRRGAVIATGRVDAIEPYFVAADAGFNPVLSGSGANVKLFEYLAARLPVISTEFGVRGSELLGTNDYIRCAERDYTAAFEALLQYPREDWQSFCEAVWQRHRHTCDITEQTRNAMATLGHHGPG